MSLAKLFDRRVYTRKLELVLISAGISKVLEISAQEHIRPRIGRWPAKIVLDVCGPVMQRTLLPDVTAGVESVNAIATVGIPDVRIIPSIAELLGDAGYIDQVIIGVQRIGGKAKDQVTPFGCAADHRFADRQ